MKQLGVIGGLGPLATAQFMEMVVRMTDAHYDRDHIPMIINSQPATPDRTRFILGQSDESPLPTMIRVGGTLAAQGVACIAIPCVTAYYFYSQLAAGVPVPIIDMISETALHLKENQVNSVGLMATDGTLAGGFFREGLEALGIRVIEPSASAQRRVMNIIYGSVKANQPVNMADFKMIENELRHNGAEVIILGCTELSAIHRDYPIGPGFLDAMEVQARKAVLLCEARLKSAFERLITR